MDNLKIEELKELENEDIIKSFDEVDKYLQYLKNSILSEDENDSESNEEVK